MIALKFSLIIIISEFDLPVGSLEVVILIPSKISGNFSITVVFFTPFALIYGTSFVSNNIVLKELSVFTLELTESSRDCFRVLWSIRELKRCWISWILASRLAFLESSLALPKYVRYVLALRNYPSLNYQVQNSISNYL